MTPLAPIPASLEDALYHVVHESGEMTPKQLASAIGVRHAYLLDAANQFRDETQFQARLIVPLTKASGNDALIRFLSFACGGAFVRLDSQQTVFDEQTARSMREFAEYLQTVADSGRDGVVTEEEAAQIEREAHECIEAILTHVKTLKTRVTPPPTPVSLRRSA